MEVSLALANQAIVAVAFKFGTVQRLCLVGPSYRYEVCVLLDLTSSRNLTYATHTVS